MARRSQTIIRYLGYAAYAVETFLLCRKRPYLFIPVINGKGNLDGVYCSSKNTGRQDLDSEAVGSALFAACHRGHRALVVTGGETLIWHEDSVPFVAVKGCRYFGNKGVEPKAPLDPPGGLPVGGCRMRFRSVV